MDSILFARAVMEMVQRCLRSDKEYGLPKGNVPQLRNRRCANFYILESINDGKMIIRSEKSKAELCCTPEKKPQTIDVIPILKEGEIVKFPPLVILPDTCVSMKSKWIIIHEVCHLLSIGDYEGSSEQKIYHHSYGLHSFTYDETFHLLSSEKDEWMNEIVNDAITWHFMEHLTGGSFDPEKEDIHVHCQKVKEIPGFKLFIGYYFSHRLEEMRNILRSI